MKKIMCLLTMVFVCILSANAQQYVNVKQMCPQCMGYGAVASYYGPVYCSVCGGSGAVVVTIANPQYYNNISFQGAQNSGSYSRTSSVVVIYTEAGICKGNYYVYLHQGQRYINFCNTWICIQGKSRFGYCGNWYIIK